MIRDEDRKLHDLLCQVDEFLYRHMNEYQAEEIMRFVALIKYKTGESYTASVESIYRSVVESMRILGIQDV